MTKFGYTLFSEMNGPKELVAQARAAERSGFDFAVISDHFHPWLPSHTNSPLAWSVLGAVADRTQRLELGTLVTCPMIRYHPAVVAQGAATIAIMSDGRFTLGLGAGENLNEHVVGHGWPPPDVRHEMLRESIEIIRRLWRGGSVTYRGRYLTVESARLYSLPDEPPPIAIAASGPASARLAGEMGDALVVVEPSAEVVKRFEAAGGQGKRKIGQVAMSYDEDEATARKLGMRFKFSLSGWTVMAELATPAQFEAASFTVREEDVAEKISYGPDPAGYLAAIRRFLEAGVDEVCVIQIGDDHEGFMRFWERELRPKLP